MLRLVNPTPDPSPNGRGEAPGLASVSPVSKARGEGWEESSCLASAPPGRPHPRPLPQWEGRGSGLGICYGGRGGNPGEIRSQSPCQYRLRSWHLFSYFQNLERSGPPPVGGGVGGG